MERRWLAGLAATAVVALIAPAGAGAADPVVVGAGNIACDPSSPYYNAGAGTATRCRQKDTSDVLAGAAAVLALGDNQYGAGALSAYNASYEPTWGPMKAITRPVAGNREYGTPGADGYFDYFNGAGGIGGPAGNRGEGYYSFDVGSWHLVALNSNCSHVACSAGSAQERWLRADLAAHPAACTLAYMHASRFSSGRPASSISVGPLYKALYEGGVDVALAAHARDYERFAPQTHVGRSSPKYGIRQFVVGTGGHSLGTFGPAKRNSEVRDNQTFGVLELTLGAVGYSWRFVPVADGTFADAGSDGCHAAPPKRRAKPKPSAPKKKKQKKTSCTVTGTAGPDVLRGTRGRDIICGLGGDDRIDGEGGNDLIRGGDGDDRIGGGTGRDRIDGNRGDDVLRGGRGGDTIRGGAGNDVLRGQSGADRLFGQGGRNRVFGNAGNDYIESSRNGRRDRISGGRGRDRARVQRGDVVRGVERVRRPARG